jgi:hypothetical protein
MSVRKANVDLKNKKKSKRAKIVEEEEKKKEDPQKALSDRATKAWFALHDVLTAGSKSKASQLTAALAGVAKAMGELGQNGDSKIEQGQWLLAAWTTDKAMGPILDGCWQYTVQEDGMLGYLAPEYPIREYYKQMFARAMNTIMTVEDGNNWLSHRPVVDATKLPKEWTDALDPKATAALGQTFAVQDWLVWKFDIVRD